MALACEHLPAAWSAVSRWRTLAPSDHDANARYALVALKLYRTADARAAVADYCRAVPAQTAPADAPSNGARRRGPGQAQGIRALADLISLLLEETDAPAVLAAMSAVPEPTASDPQALALFGELALAAYDGKRAEEFARRRA